MLFAARPVIIAALLGALVVSACGGGEDKPHIVDPTSPDAKEVEDISPPEDLPTAPEGCITHKECEVDDPCFTGVCRWDGECEVLPAPAALCDDEDLCTQLDECNELGMCVGTIPLDCDDGNGCTIDSCDPRFGCAHEMLSGDQECDGNLCTSGDSCGAGFCNPGAEVVVCDDFDKADCVFYTCDPLSGKCDKINDEPKGHPCNDGSPCTLDDNCNATGSCVLGTPYPCIANHPCKEAWCNPKVPNPADLCEVGWKAEGDGCDDNNACTSGDTCTMIADNLNCVAAPIVCEDDNMCTNDSCNTQEGCLYDPVADGTPCPLSAAFCQATGQCLAGVCSSEGIALCDDGNVCTVDSCTAWGCEHQKDDSICDDSLWCNGEESCSEVLGCVAGTGPEMDDGLPCTADFCDESLDAVLHVPDGKLCDDGIACTVGICDSGFCLHQPSDELCDDGLWCNGAETCQLAGCAPGNSPGLDDGIGCTVDSCDEESDTVVHSPDDALCSDANLCNGQEKCDPFGDCQAGNNLLCNDSLACTSDSCDPGTGCQVQPNHLACDDGNPCTADTCKPVEGCSYSGISGPKGGKLCCAASPEECKDGNPCTIDGCDLDLHQCIYSTHDDGVMCDDGLACTSGEKCLVGMCEGKATDCDDGLACTADSCEEPAGCAHVTHDELCDDDNVCTGTEICSAGLGCEAVEVPDCDDSIDCTLDTCDPETGCFFVTQDAACQDNNPCTLDTCVKGIGCQHPYVNGSGNGTVCCVAEAQECDDGIICTVDSCQVGLHQCSNIMAGEGTPCDDADLCTKATTCQGGECLGGVVDCSDAFECTVDSCDPGTGCAHQPVTSKCDDGVFCNGAEKCLANSGCTAGEPPATDDGIKCTVDWCDEDADLVMNEPDDDLCDTGLPCRIDYCDDDAGMCISQLVLDCCGNGKLEANEECDDGNVEDGDGCTKECAKGSLGTSCEDVLAKFPGAQDGIYSVEPEGYGVQAPFDVHCEMTRDGGGWTLVAVVSDDGQDNWTWTNKTYWTASKIEFGSLEQLNKDLRSAALLTVYYNDLLFVHQPSGVWASYHEVSSSQMSLGEHLALLEGLVCWQGDDGYEMSSGTLVTEGTTLCSTSLFLNAKDNEGGFECIQAPVGEHSYGPVWSASNDDGCALDDPGATSSLGPCSAYSPELEYCGVEPAVGFGKAANLNTGQPGQAENYMWVLVR